MKIGNRDFDLKNSCCIMGILNITPDSFSDGGRFSSLDRALFRVEEMLGEGMDILDIGGESTRPGYTKITEDEETERVVPVIEAVKSRFDVPVSLDTYKADVAREGIAAGADMINDIWGLHYDSGEMAKLIAETKLPCCLMHNRKCSEYADFFRDMVNNLHESLEIAEKAGISREKIILDPGIGFAKSHEQNLEAVRRLAELKAEFDMPILLGISRKSMIGNVLGLPATERLEGTIAANVVGILGGASVVRVHDVKENARAVKMTLALMKG